MSILWLIVFALLLGALIYRLFYTLVKSVRLAVAFGFMAVFFVIAQNLETIGHTWNSGGAWHVPFFSDKRAGNVSNPNEHPGPVTDVAFQSIIREDQNFLEELTQTQSQTGRPPGIPSPLKVPGIERELADNTVRVRRALAVPHTETVRRAQLVTQNEASKHPELVRSGQR